MDTYRSADLVPLNLLWDMFCAEENSDGPRCERVMCLGEKGGIGRIRRNVLGALVGNA
jgi:hypothetical protein